VKRTSRHSLEPWELVDPAGVIAQMSDRSPLSTNTVLVGVTMPRPEGHVVTAAEVVHEGLKLPDRWAAAEMIRDAAQRLAPPLTRQAPRAILVTLVCREGRVADSRREMFWMAAWRFSNHLTDAFSGDVYAVTPHGWCGTIDRRSGLTPALRPSLLSA